MSLDADNRRRSLHGRRHARRIAPSQKALLERLLPEIEITLPTAPPLLDPAQLFGAWAEEVWLEVGFGKGEHLIWQAVRNPSIGFIACEPFVNGVAALLAGIESNGIENIRIYVGDAAELIQLLPAGSLARAFILFPDPWPKKRHHKRRFISQDNLSALAEKLCDNAELRIATDHSDYCRWTVQNMDRSRDFEWLAEGPDDWRCRTDDWPSTRYEEKALRKGAKCAYLRYSRRVRDCPTTQRP